MNADWIWLIPIVVFYVAGNIWIQIDWFNSRKESDRAEMIEAAKKWEERNASSK